MIDKENSSGCWCAQCSQYLGVSGECYNRIDANGMRRLVQMACGYSVTSEDEMDMK